MLFWVDSDLKIIVGWSAKCGCTHVMKIFWYLKTNNDDYKIHTPEDNCPLPTDVENYTTILIIRNPYERLVSGFIDKYNQYGEYRHLWKHNNTTFSKFVNELLKNDWLMIDKHHFIQQTKENFNETKLSKSKVIQIFDINNINYAYIEQLYNKKIPEKLLKFRGGHERKSVIKLEKYIYDIDMSLYYEYNVPVKYFYSNDIKEKVFSFYENDFIIFKQYGFDYTKSLSQDTLKN